MKKLRGLVPFAIALALCPVMSCSRPDQGNNKETSGLASITAAEVDALRDAIPPPPKEAILIRPKDALRNGPWVVKKQRHVWVPPGEKIRVEGGAFVVPLGTRVWKDFYYRESGMAEPVLIERRLLVKVEPGSAPDGWLFLSSYATPGVDLSKRVGTVLLESPSIAAFALNPAAALPVNPYPSEVKISVAGQSRYVFPGTRNCTVCHDGATGFFPGNPPAAPVLSFNLHPATLTEASYTAMVGKGWLDEASTKGLAATSVFPQEEPLRAKVLGTLRNNCLTCHNTSPRAAARHSQFRLDANKPYTAAELAVATDVLAVTGVALFDRKAPDNSEIPRRVLAQARGQMPPQEGGVPVVDEEAADLFQSWAAAQVGSRSFKNRRGMIECPSGFERMPVGSAGAVVCTNGESLLGPFTKTMRDKCKTELGGEPCNDDLWELEFGLSIRGTDKCPRGSKLDATTGYCVEGIDVFGPFPAYLQQRCIDVAKGGPACLKARWALDALKASL